MCGYCIEKAMIDLLDREMGSSAPLSEDQMSILLLDSHTQETGFPMHCLKHAREWDKELDILYVLHCRALEEIVARPGSAAKSSLPHNALVKHYHAYRRMASSRFEKKDELKDILPHPSWIVLYDPDFVFSPVMWREFTARTDLPAQCAELLERYHAWWLKGEGQHKNDLDQRLEETGVLDPIEDIAREDRELFYSLFPAVSFALFYQSRYGEDLTPVENVALTDVAGVPDFTGFDLWLQRRALACSVQARGASFLLDNLGPELRPLLIFYGFLRFEAIREKKELICSRMMSVIEKNDFSHEVEEEVHKYKEKMNCYEQ